MAHFGNALVSELEGVEGKTKQEIETGQMAILKTWLGEEAGDGDKPPPGRYRDPAAEMGR